ncbi:MAG: dihydropteroate synthase [Desulfovibrionaceae bacterium]|nr:dihydropteroate synthase [Desulfovibrionaceae bacterium]
MGGGVLGPAPFFVAGIVNVTPDSFYDRGRHPDPERAVAHALDLAAQGADILDVGGESTRPFAAEVDAAEEAGRVIPVITALAREFGPGRGPVLSVDTYKAPVAAQALEAGARIVNDVSACAFDPGLIEVLAQYRPGYVLMHSQGRPGEMQKAPRYRDVVSEVLSFFEDRLAVLVRAGLPEARIVLDPGIGFGKLLEHNLELLKNVERFMALGRPLYLGLSNKSLWGGLLGLEVHERSGVTQAATALMAARGVAVHRVHEVDAARQALTVVLNLSPGR